MTIQSLDEWKILLLKAENEEIEAMNEVAYYYSEGLTIDTVELVKVDKQLAFNWTKKAYEKGNFEATENYAKYLTEKDNIMID